MPLPSARNAVEVDLSGRVILVTGAVGLFGTAALAGYGTASRLDYVMIPILFGLCTATLTMVGVNIGAGETARARRIAWTSAFVGLALAEGANTVRVRSRGATHFTQQRLTCRNSDKPPARRLTLIGLHRKSRANKNAVVACEDQPPRQRFSST